MCLLIRAVEGIIAASIQVMKFYIVTPAYNALHWLQGCVRSVADQVGEGVEVHHHVQDGASKDATVAWLEAWQQQHAHTPGYKLTFESAPDAGMYDALNKAWDKMPENAEITAHLNCDEQYLPSALEQVALAMTRSPEADIAISSYIIIDAQSRYICHRRPVNPCRWIGRTVCEIITCACFHRVDFFKKHGVRFDPKWRSIGDLIFYSDILRHSPRCMVLPRVFTSVFRVTGNNLAWSDVTAREWVVYEKTLPAHSLKLKKLAAFISNVKRRSSDWWYPSPSSYSFYNLDEVVRSSRIIKTPTSHWGCRSEGED